MPITIFAHGHFPEDLNQNFENLFKKCNILVAEVAVKEKYDDVKTYLNQLSQIGYSDDTFLSPVHPEYSWKLQEFIKNSKKQIEVEKSPISLKELKNQHHLGDEVCELFVNGKLEGACNKALEFYQLEVEIDKKREASFVEQLIELYEENEDKEILVLYGAAHPIYYELKERGINVKREFPYLPLIFPLPTELERKLRFGIPYTKDLVAQAIIVSAVETYLRDLGMSSIEAMRKSNRIVRKLSYDEIKDLSKYISENSLARKMPIEAMVVWLKKRGYEI